MSRYEIIMTTKRYINDTELPAFFSSLEFAGYPKEVLNRLKKDFETEWRQQEFEVVTKIEMALIDQPTKQGKL